MVRFAPWPSELAPTPFSLSGKQERKCNSVFVFNIILIFLCCVSFEKKKLKKALFSTGKDLRFINGSNIFKNVKKIKLLI